MRWKTERTDEFEEWWEALTDAERRQALSSIEALELSGPSMGRPFVDSVKGSRYPNMKELTGERDGPRLLRLRSETSGDPLIGGDKAGKTKRFYRQMVSRADRIYDAHLRRIMKGASSNGRR